MSSQIVNVEWKSKNFWQNKVSEIRVSEIRGSEIRGSEIRVNEIRVSEIRVSKIRISSNHRELHGAIFCVNMTYKRKLLKVSGSWISHKILKHVGQLKIVWREELLHERDWEERFSHDKTKQNWKQQPASCSIENWIYQLTGEGNWPVCTE